jgi:tRNA(Ile)-lysidine synthetase-like protein
VSGLRRAPHPAEVLAAALARVTAPGERLALAVSGGSDSVALAGLVAARAPDRALVLHVHHGLRADADRDAAFVRELCRGLALPLRELGAPPLPSDPGRSETAARRRRLAALARGAREAGCAWVLTAHHLEDALETLLLHLSRGHRGVRALAGIPTARPLVEGVGLLRPFLVGARPPGRRDLEAARNGLGLDCVLDETNADRSVPRNALRAELLRGVAPLSTTHLAPVRRAAIGSLSRLVGQAARILGASLLPAGRGARLTREGLVAMGADPGLTAETLRLLGGCLAAPRQLAIRASVLARLVEAGDRQQGELPLPASPAPLLGRLRPDGLHFPSERLSDGDPDARVLAAVARTPVHL